MKKYLSAVLICVLVVGLLAGCTGTTTTTTASGTTKATTTSGTTTGGTTTGGTTTSTGAEPGPNFKFDPPITITIVDQDVAAASGGAWDNEDNAWIDLYRDRYGINLEYMWIVDSAQYTERVNLMLAGGDVPDFFNANAIQFQQAFEYGLIQAVDEVFDMYTTQTTKDLMMEAGMMPFEACMRDDKMYAIPWTTLAHESANVIHVRQDWLDLLGAEPLTTFQNLEAYFAAVKDKKPGGVAWSISEDSGLSRLMAMAPMFGAFPDHWVEMPDGSLQHGVLQPEMKEAVAQFAAWFEAGYIDPEFGTSSGTKRAENIAAGTVGFNMDPFWHPLAWQAAKNNDSKCELSFFEMPTKSGQPFIFPSVGVGVAGYYLTSGTCEHPEAFPLMLNSFMEIFYLSTDKDEGEKYINWADGTPIWQAAFAKAYRHYKNYQQSKDIAKYLDKAMSFDDLPADTKNVASRIDEFMAGDNSTWGWYQIYGPGRIFTPVGKIIDDKRFHDNAFYGPTPQSMTDYQAILDKLELETFTSMITGGKDVAEWDSFVTQWYDLGGKDITDDVNEWKKRK